MTIQELRIKGLICDQEDEFLHKMVLDLRPEKEFQILICCSYTFPKLVVGRRWLKNLCNHVHNFDDRSVF